MVSEAFMALTDYALAQGWKPIGFRSFTIWPWDVTVNGTKEDRDDVPPYHARITHQDVIAIMVINPWGGSVGGWPGTEDAFIADVRAALHGKDADAPPPTPALELTNE